MKNELKNYGFKAPVITPDQHILGSGTAYEVLKEDRQWDNYLPLYEPQAENWESFGCTVWGSENATEILHKFLFGIEPNYSERYIYNLAGLTRESGGADPHYVLEVIRLSGLINQELLPMTPTYEEFIKPRPMEKKYVEEGLKFLGQYILRHDWILTGNESQEVRIARIKENLKYSPLGVSVTAWFEENGIYVDRGQPNTHWCVCYGWTDKGWKIFDSYDHSTKIYSFDSVISFAKRFLIKKKDFYPEKKSNWIIELIISFFNLFKALLGL